MAKVATDGIIDGGLDKLILTTNLTVCAGQPVSFADIAVKALATHTLTGGDWTKADGGISGRRATMAQQADFLITTTGTADHVVVDDGVAEYQVTTCSAVALTSGQTVTVNAFDSEIADPI